MGDVAQILGIQANADPTTGNSNNDVVTATAAIQKPPPEPSSHSIPVSIQNASSILNKPVLKLLSGKTEAQKHLSSSTLPPIVPSHNMPLQTIQKGIIQTNNNRSTPTPPLNHPNSFMANQQTLVKINNKFISSAKKARSWVFAPFSNSARKDGLLLHHWVRAGVEYPEYPYARFNIHLDELSYRNEAIDIQNLMNIKNSTGNVVSSNTAAPKPKTEDEINTAVDEFYHQYLHDDNWTQSETDTLLELCRVYELRWPVIADRWIGKYGSLSSKKVEDLQHRYYTIGYSLNKMRVERAAKVEAENLAKAIAAASQNILPSSTSVVGVSSTSLLGDVKSNDTTDTLQAEQTIASAIASSSSTAVNSLAGAVKANLQPPIPATNTGTSNQRTFDLDAERQRRKVLDNIWARTKEEEWEEIELKKELKLVEAQIRKLKKSGSHILAAAAVSSVNNNGGTDSGATSSNAALNPSGIESRGQSPLPLHPSSSSTAASIMNNNNNNNGSIGNNASSQHNDIINAQFATTAPIPTPGTPYLQSGRQKQPAIGGQMGINKTTLKRMDQILLELHISETPIATKRCCDLYDHVRKDALMLLTLQKLMITKENEVLSKRMKLEKISGKVIQQQEAAAAAAAAAAAQAAAKAEKAANSTNAKGSGKGTSGSKGGGSSAAGTGSSSVINSNNSGSGTSKKGSSSSTKGSTKKGSSSSNSGKTKKKKKPSSSESGGANAGPPTKKRKSSPSKKSNTGASKTSKTGNTGSKGSSPSKAAATVDKATSKLTTATVTSPVLPIVAGGGSEVTVKASTATEANTSDNKPSTSELINSSTTTDIATVNTDVNTGNTNNNAKEDNNITKNNNDNDESSKTVSATTGQSEDGSPDGDDKNETKINTT